MSDLNLRKTKSRPPSSDEFLAGCQCPKFGGCGAAYCPLLGGLHLKDDPVCQYLRESVKTGGVQRINGALSPQLADAVVRDGVRLIASTGPLARALKRAAGKGSRIASISRNSSTRGADR